MPRIKNTDIVKQRLTELEAMSIEELKERWHHYFDYKPPRYQREYMLPRIAYAVQAHLLGGLSKKAKNKLKRLAFQDQVSMKRKFTPKPGTRLVRDWNGKRHTVLVRSDGYEYEGQIYKSLSAVAKAIVGCPRSGPEFFGIKGDKYDD